MKSIISSISLGICVLFSISSLTLALPHHEEGHVGNGTDEETAVVGLPADTPENELDFNMVRFHEESKLYYPIGSSTPPCNDNQRFFAVPDDRRLGKCDCDWYQCSRPLLFDRKTDKCHWAWSKGPCAEGEWYTFAKGMLPECEKNPCLSEKSVEEPNFIFKNPDDGKCYVAGTQGYCLSEDETLAIYPMEPIPACRNYTLCNPLSIPAQQLCLQGSRRHQDGFCNFP